MRLRAAGAAAEGKERVQEGEVEAEAVVVAAAGERRRCCFLLRLRCAVFSSRRFERRELRAGEGKELRVEKEKSDCCCRRSKKVEVATERAAGSELSSSSPSFPAEKAEGSEETTAAVLQPQARR